VQTARTLAQPDAARGARPAERGPARDRAWSEIPESVKVAAAVCVTWALLIVGTTAYQTDFISHQTVLSVTFTMAVVGVLAVAEGLVVISGGMIDLSLPTSLILAAAVTTTLLDRGWNIVLVVLVAMAIGGAWGALNATIIVFGKINPIIVTLGTNLAGVALLNIHLTGYSTIPPSSGLATWGDALFLGLPNVFWVMVLAILLAGYLLPRTRVGTRALAVGGSTQAAKVRGISLRRTRFGVFITSGMVVGVAAVLFAASTHSFSVSDGTTYLLPPIAAVIVAGISLAGGSGNLWVLFASVGLLSTVPTSMAFFGLSDLWQQVPPGLILVAAVSIDGFRRKRASR
jgi:ribose/xylose/arabinose/galactoside ABC-type transport system permease subunit